MDLSAASLSLPMDTRLWWGRGVRAADTTAQFKEMEQEMWADSEQSSLYVYLSWAWENSGQSRLCLFFQAGRQVYVQVLHSATQALVCNVFAGGWQWTMCHISQWQLSADGCRVHQSVLAENITSQLVEKKRKENRRPKKTRSKRNWLQLAAWPLTFIHASVAWYHTLKYFTCFNIEISL